MFCFKEYIALVLIFNKTAATQNVVADNIYETTPSTYGALVEGDNTFAEDTTGNLTVKFTTTAAAGSSSVTQETMLAELL